MWIMERAGKMEGFEESGSFDDDNNDIEDFQLTKKQQIERFKQVTSQQDIDKWCNT